MKRTARPVPCLTCGQRTWRSLHGFMVMGCALKGLRFGIAPDIARRHVNKAGGCVAMPVACAEAERACGQQEGRSEKPASSRP